MEAQEYSRNVLQIFNCPGWSCPCRAIEAGALVLSFWTPSEFDGVTGGAAGVPGLAGRLDPTLRLPRPGRSRGRSWGRQ